MYGILVIEMQKDWILEGSVLDKGEMVRAIIPRIQRLLDVARERKVPVIYCNLCLFKQADDPLAKRFPPHGVPGTPGAEVVDELKPKEEDYIINMHRFDAFLYSDLEFVLKVAGVDTLIISGVTTQLSCLSTAMHALQMGFNVIMASDCCAAEDEQRHQMGLNYLKPFVKIITADEVLKLLQKQA